MSDNEYRRPSYVIRRGIERAAAGRVWAEKRMVAVKGADGDLQGELSTVIQSGRVWRLHIPATHDFFQAGPAIGQRRRSTENKRTRQRDRARRNVRTSKRREVRSRRLAGLTKDALAPAQPRALALPCPLHGTNSDSLEIQPRDQTADCDAPRKAPRKTKE